MKRKGQDPGRAKPGDVGLPRVEYMDLATIVRAPRNPKAHDLGALGASMDRFGFVAPLLVNERTGRLVAGGGRLDALQARKAAGGPPPSRVRAVGDRWEVPVLRGVAFATDAEAEAYLVADNRLVELGGWDDGGLATLLADLAAGDHLTGTGYDRDEVDALLRDLGRATTGAEDPGAKPERAAEFQKKWKTARGQLWAIGRHRLLCGDATNPLEVSRLRKGATFDAMLTDPPYCSGGFQEAGRSKGSVGTDRKDVKMVANDTLSTRGYMALLKSVTGLVDPAAAYVFTDWRMWVNLFDVMESSGFGVRNMIVWDKGTPGMGVGWRAQHELVMFATKAKPGFDNHKAQGNVIRSQRTGNVHHTVEKPVDLLEAILLVSDFAQVIADPFTGSGSTFVAAERTGRTCYGAELDPEYLAVALERLAGMDLKPTLAP